MLKKVWSKRKHKAIFAHSSYAANEENNNNEDNGDGSNPVDFLFEDCKSDRECPDGPPFASSCRRAEELGLSSSLDLACLRYPRNRLGEAELIG